MKAITIHQPWATLIALSEKRFETRGWATKYRGDLAIHAGKHIDRAACEIPGIASALRRHGYHTPDDLPTGSIVAVTNLKDCHESIFDYGTRAILNNNRVVTGLEYFAGNYEKGRYAWQLDDLIQLDEPIPAKGQQGLWNWGGERDASRA